MLILHFIGLAMGLGVAFANLFLGIAAKKMAPEEVIPFRMKTMALARMGHIGLALLLISGFYLITPFWKTLGTMPTLIAKLVGVVILVILIIRSCTMRNWQYAIRFCTPFCIPPIIDVMAYIADGSKIEKTKSLITLFFSKPFTNACKEKSRRPF